jgi:ketosteroid isomerase-like protein
MRDEELFMIRQAVALLAGFAGIGAAHAATLTPLQIAQRHMEFAAKGDVDAIMGDYADNAVNLTAGKSVQGKAAIRQIFVGMMARLKPGEPSPVAAMKILKSWEEGDVGYITWQMGAMTGTEEFLVRDGKILVQAVFVSTAAAAK